MSCPLGGLGAPAFYLRVRLGLTQTNKHGRVSLYGLGHDAVERVGRLHKYLGKEW
jgi:hypothetical protein